MEGQVFYNVRERLRIENGRIRTLGPDYLLYALIDAIVDHYYIVSETMGNKIEDLEEILFNGILQDDLSLQVLSLKKEVLKTRRVIFPIREIISRIEKNEHVLIKPTSIQYYRDVYDHVIQLSDAIEIYRDRKSTRLNSSHVRISYAVFCLKKKNKKTKQKKSFLKLYTR